MNTNSDILEKKLPAGRKFGGEAGPDFHPTSPLPDAEGNCGVVGDLGISITLRSLNHAQPSEIALVAMTFIEIGRQLLDHLPPQPAHTNH